MKTKSICTVTVALCSYRAMHFYIPAIVIALAGRLFAAQSCNCVLCRIDCAFEHTSVLSYKYQTTLTSFITIARLICINGVIVYLEN